MYNVRKLTDDLTWIGVSDRKITKFENVYKLNSGMNYNSYFLDCGASILIDTVDKALEDVFFDILKSPIFLSIADFKVSANSDFSNFSAYFCRESFSS